ncbi:hypothetical protein CR513_07929, partial [Mucuna pruriens]
MKEEMNVLEKNSTWEIVDRPKDKRCKSDGTLERYKARLVVKGYTQTYKIYYKETFAPVAEMNMFDVKNVFLHGDIEEVYMEILLGFHSHNEKNKVRRLKKALYGLKQSPRAWFGRFAQVMISLGYRQSQGDRTLFIKHSPDSKLTLLLVYVDNMIVTSDDEIEKLTLKDKLTTQFEMKELGKLKYFLGIEVVYSKQDQNHRIGCEESPTIEKSQYQRLVGKLIYSSNTRLDIARVVSVVSQFMHDPRERHLQTVERILQYLKAILGEGLLFRKEGTLSIYTNADYAGSVMDRRFTFRYCMFLGGYLVTWRSKRQSMVARSKFRVMTHGICEGLWMKIILDDLKVKYEGHIKLFCDNNSTISIAHNSFQHDRTKHIEIDRYFIKEKLNSRLVITTHVPTWLQI